jgi:two-component system, response regulator YesN
MYTLLIADDEQLERDAIEQLVTSSALPLACIKARNGREAVEFSQTNVPDIALLDIRMPGINGIEAARRIKEMHPQCRIVFLTAWNSFDFAQEAIRIGAKDFLVKPSVNKDVLALLSKFILELNQAQTRTQQNTEKIDISEVLNLFSKNFFSSLKYGSISEEAMRSYFTLQGIVHEQGIACVLDGNNEQTLHHYFQEEIQKKSLQACYFSDADRISVLAFSPYPEALSTGWQNKMLTFKAHPLHIGLSRPFFSLLEIPASLRQASCAYHHAINMNLASVAYTDIPLIPANLQHKNEELEQKLINLVLEGQINEARRLATEILDDLLLGIEDDNTASMEKLYETILFITRNIGTRIPNLLYQRPQKTNLLELEEYIMDFIDTACLTVLEDKKDKYSRIFSSMREFIEGHYAEQITLDQMAGMAGISAGYFSKLFREYTGHSFIEFLNSIRIRAAKQMIQSGMKIQQVAENTGFSDYSYFSRVFRASEGVSPREFQQNPEKQ